MIWKNVKQIYGVTGWTGMQNIYRGRLVMIWKNVKKVGGLPKVVEDPVRTRYPRSSSDLNFPGRAGRAAKV